MTGHVLHRLISRRGYRRGASERGQALIEMAAILPLLILLVLGTLEFGMIFDHHLSLEYATREGARTGSALANADGVTPDCNEIDQQVVAAVERVLTSPGSAVDLSEVSQIRIYKSQANGSETTGLVNVWSYTPGAGPVVDGSALDFSQTSHGWNACTRSNVQTSPDKIGVSLTYTYRFRTALSAFTGGTASLTMTDRTVMTLNPL